MINAKEIIKQMNDGLYMFGNYNFWDKGPSEVIEVHSIVGELKKLKAKQVKDILEKVFDDSDEGARLANHLVGRLDDMPNDWFDELLTSKKLEY